jgi:hypothetical protein
MHNIDKLLDKCESMTLLCTKASSHWSFVKFCFNIPLVLTSSTMCIINSISEDANAIKIPNIIVNAVSVLIMSLTNSIKASEKFEIFKKLSQQFMLLSQEIEACDGSVSKETYNILSLKYDNLIQDCSFEEIPVKYKIEVAKCFSDADRYIPIQLNGIIGNTSVAKRLSGGKKETPLPQLSQLSQLSQASQLSLLGQSEQAIQASQMLAQGASLVNISTMPPKNDLPTTTATGQDTKIYGAGENV